MPNKLEKLCMGCGIVLLVGSAGVSQAEETTPHFEDRDGTLIAKDLEVKVGAIGLYRPEYEGSDDYEFSALPQIDVRFQERYFLNMQDGLGMDILVGENYRAGAAIGYAFGRDDDGDLAGMGEIDGGAKASIFGEYRVGRLNLSSKLSHQFTGEDDAGFTADFKAAVPLRATDKFVVVPSISTTFASEDYMQTNFGVSSVQAANTGFAQYNPESGFKDMTLAVGANYALDEDWSLSGQVGYSRLIGDAADSPIVKDENQFFTGLGVVYQF